MGKFRLIYLLTKRKILLYYWYEIKKGVKNEKENKKEAGNTERKV
jgi:hypothetical protein